MSRRKLLSLTIIVSLLSGLLAGMLVRVHAAAGPADYFAQTTNKLNLDKGWGNISLNPVAADNFIAASQSPSCNTYYLRRNTANVGADGVQKIANVTAPTASTPAVASLQLPLLSDFSVIARFYSDPALAANYNMGGDISGSLWVQASQLNTTFRLEMFDYNPVSGSSILLGAYDFGLLSTGQTEIAFNITPSTTSLASGHRFLLVLSGKPPFLNSSNVSLFYDSPGRPSRFISCQLTPPLLSISKSGPTVAGAGELVTYVLTIANSGDTSATNLVISDTIPAGANYVSGGTKVGNVVRWTAASLAADTSIQRTFTVTATSTINNNNYQVVADNNVSAVGQPAVVTTIGNGPIPKLYLPVVFKTEPQTFLIVDSQETGGIDPVQILNPSNGQELLRCTVGNNVKVSCGSFPAIGTYKIVAHTHNCGVLQGTFHDAAPGATVTRRVYCR
jgi:uncharacterized repeat protein (TIGR01451 family)